MSDPETLAVYNQQADEYLAMMDDFASKDPHIGKFIVACAAGGTVLDLGCGPGGYAMQMAQAGLTVEALDASEEMIARITDTPGITARVATFDDVAGTDLYDGIWANFSLLHAPRDAFPRHLGDIKTALKPGAPFFIGLKTGSGGHRDKIGRHYEYYERAELEGLLSDAGFGIKEAWTGRSAGLSGEDADWIVVHAHG